MTEWIGSPSWDSTTTLSLPFPVTHACPAGSMAMSKGLTRPSAGGVMLRACSGRPLGIRVTLRAPQLAIQMFPSGSDTIPCGWTMPPVRQPRGGETARPSGPNCETLRLSRLASRPQADPWKPKFPAQTSPWGSSVIPKPAP
ncbi:hypothetical protein [Kitasatospora sp. MAA4]|uniref:hypothetical protein n=1 Tax=Kitasatospora sp. MAA4 TaxID=3035093 RepID=UPI0024734E1D|nr:hypothetical protein [Kitasatospora sp. MAA4]